MAFVTTFSGAPMQDDEQRRSASLPSGQDPVADLPRSLEPQTEIPAQSAPCPSCYPKRLELSELQRAGHYHHFDEKQYLLLLLVLVLVSVRRRWVSLLSHSKGPELSGKTQVATHWHVCFVQHFCHVMHLVRHITNRAGGSRR